MALLKVEIANLFKHGQMKLLFCFTNLENFILYDRLELGRWLRECSVGMLEVGMKGGHAWRDGSKAWDSTSFCWSYTKLDFSELHSCSVFVCLSFHPHGLLLFANAGERIVLDEQD
jgi:hypothetical protein